jgi:uroporphyrinogen-III synthase
VRLLVTRPEPDAIETAARLAAMGHEVLLQPMLRVVFNEPPVGLPVPVALIATSRNGVRALADWPSAAGWRGMPLFVTGEGSARTARDLGFTDIRSGGADAAALAGRVLDDLGRGAGPIVYAAARDRTGALAGGLLVAGHDVRTVEAYRAEPVTTLDSGVEAALRAGRIDGILFFSERTATAFVAAAAAGGLVATLAGVVCYALSERVAGPLRGVSSRVRVADRPDFDGIAALLSVGGRSSLA